MHLRPLFRFVAPLWSLSVLAFSTAGIAREAQGPSPRRAFQLRLVPIRQGNRESSFGDDPARFQATPLSRAAQLAEADIEPPSHPLFVHSVKKGRLFYLFYNDVDNAVGKQYLVQRIKKTIRNYSSAGDTSPQTRTTFLVEVSKVRRGGTIKPDQHFGVYHLGSFFRRHIVKQIEVGVGNIPGTVEGDTWPFERRRLFKKIQDYSPDPDVYDSVEYEASRTWTISVSFDRRGGYSIAVPELGIDAPATVPSSSADQMPQEWRERATKGPRGGVKDGVDAEDPAEPVRHHVPRPEPGKAKY
jgi:hypothetical protein